MHNTIHDSQFKFSNQTSFYSGKVRDVYGIGDDYLVMVVSDRISAFDVILPKAIPFKGQVLNQLASRNLNATKHLVPNWVIDVPDPNVTIGLKCDPLKVEMVIRGYLAGHAWREYSSGKREVCGVPLPDGLNENDKLPDPIITPTTKASHGHDMDISREQIIADKLVEEENYLQLEKYTRTLFEAGTKDAADKGLILVDTKYEFGIHNDKIILIDEIHTPDSSRFFYSEGYGERQKEGVAQKQLSKEFLRQWLISNDFQGLPDQSIPEMNDEIVTMVSERYIELYENITGENFKRADTTDITNRIQNNVEASLLKLRN
jgi:phosphoribosylaminoimidazole-succinocarboxamide synthase